MAFMLRFKMAVTYTTLGNATKSSVTTATKCRCGSLRSSRGRNLHIKIALQTSQTRKIELLFVLRTVDYNNNGCVDSKHCNIRIHPGIWTRAKTRKVIDKNQ